MTDLVVVGRIRKPHGIRGELVVEALCDDPAAHFAAGRRVFLGPLGAQRVPLATEVTHARPFKEGWLLHLRDVTDRNAVEAWRGRELLVPESELTPPGEDELWLHEMAGMQVLLVDGSTVGEVLEVFELPQGFLLDVRTPRGTVSVPFVDAIVTDLDREARTITIDPPEGLLEL
jgi:16S rRNA processing protein RimM